MQLGMIGLGRMGGNMVRRLMRAGHACVGYAHHADKDLEQAGMVGVSTAADLAKKLTAPRTICLMVPVAAVDGILEELLPHLEKGDTIIDGGNSYYHDDIARAKRLGHEGHPLRRHGHERRRVGPRARLLPHDRRRSRRREAARSDLRGARAGPRRHPADTRPGQGARDVGAGLPALRPVWRRPLREDGAQRHRIRPDGRLRRGHQHPAARQRRQDRTHGRRRDDAAAESRALSVRLRPGGHHRSLAPRQRRRLLAAGSDGAGLRRRSRRCRSSRAACPTPAKAAGRSRRPTTRACRPTCWRPRSSSGSRHGARPTSRTACSRRCASASAATWRKKGMRSRSTQPRIKR